MAVASDLAMDAGPTELRRYRLMSLKVKQETTYKGKDWWQWAVWLDGSANELDKISHVVYTLHPTFPTPVRRVDNRKEKFRLDSAGWGEFEIYMDIVY